MTTSIFDKFLAELRLSGLQLYANQISQYHGRVYGLNLHGMEVEDFEKFPLNSPYLRGIQKLHLPKYTNNKYPSIFHLRSLTHLCLSSSGGGNLPSAFYTLHKLKVVNLAANNISMIDEKLKYLSELRCFALGSNSIEDLPDIFSEFQHLEYLNLYNNRIKKLPNSLGNLKNLKILKIHKNNIRQIPHNLMNLTNLLELKYHDNPVVSQLTPANVLWLQILEEKGCKLRKNQRSDQSKCYEFDIIPPR